MDAEQDSTTSPPPRAAENACRWEGCGKRFDSPAGLHKHVIDVHVGSAKDGGTVCLYCRWQDCRDAQSGKKFHRRYSIVSHMLVHVPLFQFCCKECGRDFKRRPDLNKHVPLCQRLCRDDDGDMTPWGKVEPAVASVPSYIVSPLSETMASPTCPTGLTLGSPSVHCRPTGPGHVNGLGCNGTPLLSAAQDLEVFGLGSGQSPLLDALGATLADKDPGLGDLHSLPGLLDSGSSPWLTDTRSSATGIYPLNLTPVSAAPMGSLGGPMPSRQHRLTQKRLAEAFIWDLTTIQDEKARPWDVEDLPEVLGGYTQEQLDQLSDAMVVLLNGIQNEIRRKTDHPLAYHPYKVAQPRTSGSSGQFVPSVNSMSHTAAAMPHYMVPEAQPPPSVGSNSGLLTGGTPHWAKDDFTMGYDTYLLSHQQDCQDFQTYQLPIATQPPIPPPGYPFPGVEATGPHAMLHRSLATPPELAAEGGANGIEDQSCGDVTGEPSEPAPVEEDQDGSHAPDPGQEPTLPVPQAPVGVGVGDCNVPSPASMAGVFQAFGHRPEAALGGPWTEPVQVFNAQQNAGHEAIFQQIYNEGISPQPSEVSGLEEDMESHEATAAAVTVDTAEESEKVDSVRAAVERMGLGDGDPELATLGRQLLLVERLLLALSYFGDPVEGMPGVASSTVAQGQCVA